MPQSGWETHVEVVKELLEVGEEWKELLLRTCQKSNTPPARSGRHMCRIGHTSADWDRELLQTIATKEVPERGHTNPD